VTDSAMHAVKRGMAAAVRGCGSWPVVGELAEYLTAAHSAGREGDRAIESWVRWRRRFAPDPDRLELGSTRTNTRYEVARAMFKQRNEVVRLLTLPESGSA
jgi:hypothetical protein